MIYTLGMRIRDFVFALLLAWACAIVLLTGTIMWNCFFT